MGEITSASQEQSAGIAQVNSTILEMDETTQQNAALVEEAAAAAAALQDQAANLARVVSVFKLDHETASYVAPVAERVSTDTPPAALRKEMTVAPAPRMSAKQSNGSDWEEF
jgi:methyl-accepting chemotaxis protein